MKVFSKLLSSFSPYELTFSVESEREDAFFRQLAIITDQEWAAAMNMSATRKEDYKQLFADFRDQLSRSLKEKD